jgi:hypothetical protein
MNLINPCLARYRHTTARGETIGASFPALVLPRVHKCETGLQQETLPKLDSSARHPRLAITRPKRFRSRSALGELGHQDAEPQGVKGLSPTGGQRCPPSQ